MIKNIKPLFFFTFSFYSGPNAELQPGIWAVEL